jgi:hypothetical protein
MGNARPAIEDDEAVNEEGEDMSKKKALMILNQSPAECDRSTAPSPRMVSGCWTPV